jgi:hypothetical protein
MPNFLETWNLLLCATIANNSSSPGHAIFVFLFSFLITHFEHRRLLLAVRRLPHIMHLGNLDVVTCLPQNVSNWLSQLGQTNLKFSILLSSLTPLA